MSLPKSIIEIAIEDVAFGGNGVARSDGKVVFVPLTIEGEKVAAKIVKQKKKFAEAELVSVIEASEFRTEPACPYFGRCGGCSYQHISYDHQLQIKTRQVEQTLRRVGSLRDIPMLPVVPSPLPYHYRNRIRVHISGGIIGFYRRDKHELLDIQRCSIASPFVNEALQRLRERPVYDGDYTLAENSGERFFEQTNEPVAKEMLKFVEGLLNPDRVMLVDAYCGAGFFAKSLRCHFKFVVGIEENDLAVAHARNEALANEIYLNGDVEDHLPDVLSREDPGRTTLILDPPAIGVSNRVTDQILMLMPVEVIYVSCNPATLARDLGRLSIAYEIVSVRPFDMFPQTAEIEVVAQLLKKSPSGIKQDEALL